MWYEIKNYPNVEGCVYKLWYSEKYIVVKCKTMARSIENFNIGLKYFFKETPKGQKEDDLHFDFYAHVEANPFNEFTIEVLKESNNPFELLKAEYLALEVGYDDINCLNKEFDSYIPINTQVNGKRSWINRGYYLNFMQWKKKYLSQNKTV